MQENPIDIEQFRISSIYNISKNNKVITNKILIGCNTWAE